jgi:hypothetical protein
MEARRLYRIKKRKEERPKPTRIFEVKENGVGKKHKQWLDALNELDSKPVEAPMEEVREYPVLKCHCC